MNKIALAVILLFVSAPHLHAQSNRIASIDTLLTGMTQQDLFSGAVLVADSSGILLSKGYGYADRENKVKFTPDTRSDISTAANIFTGTAIAWLAQKGKLKLTDTIGRYIKGLPKGDVITIQQLLTHSSGLDFFENAKGFSYKGARNCTDVMPFMRTLPLKFTPGDSCQYSSGNLIVLGAVIEKVSGKSFQDFITQTFIQPLGLQHTGYVPYWTLNDSQREYSIGYTKTDAGYRRRAFDYDNGFIPLSAGGNTSSATDLYRFDKAVFSGKVLSGDYLKMMTARYTRPWDGAYFGYLWIHSDKKDHSSIGHLGRSSGWHTTNEYYPRQKYFLVLLTNLGSVDMDALTEKVEQLLFSE